jgi:hypothetical protein
MILENNNRFHLDGPTSNIPLAISYRHLRLYLASLCTSISFGDSPRKAIELITYSILKYWLVFLDRDGAFDANLI